MKQLARVFLVLAAVRRRGFLDDELFIMLT